MCKMLFKSDKYPYRDYSHDFYNLFKKIWKMAQMYRQWSFFGVVCNIFELEAYNQTWTCYTNVGAVNEFWAMYIFTKNYQNDRGK